MVEGKVMEMGTMNMGMLWRFRILWTETRHLLFVFDCLWRGWWGMVVLERVELDGLAFGRM